VASGALLRVRIRSGLCLGGGVGAGRNRLGLLASDGRERPEDNSRREEN
jgi:hypothetical protein